MDHIKRAFLKTTLGYIEVTASDKGIQTLVFLPFKIRVHRVPAQLKTCLTQLEEYFSGQRRSFDLPLDLSGTDFQKRVWRELVKIPYGSAITYHELAIRIGKPNAFRAVGGANGHNPVSIIIPCHRVIGNNGKLVGYAGGLWRKKWLLEHEHAFAQRDLFYEEV